MNSFLITFYSLLLFIQIDTYKLPPTKKVNRNLGAEYET